jgi:glycosyltransferase involved in cell wall biosynthesis
MKILLTVHQFFPQFTTGTEVLTCSVALDLIARGHQVHVLTAHPAAGDMADEERFDEYDYKGIHVYRFHHAFTPMAGHTSKVELTYDNRLATAYFARIVERFKPDVVHFFHLSRLGSGLIEHAAQACIRAYMTPTDFWAVCTTGQLMLCDGSKCRGPSAYAGNCVKHFAEDSQTGLAAKVAKWLPTAGADLLVRLTQAGVLPPYPYSDEVRAISARLGINIARLNQLRGIFSPNRFMTELLVRHGVSPQLITQSAFGIDVTGSESNISRQPPRQPLRLGFVGSLAHHKGCHVLIDAFKTLPAGRATLKIYGNMETFPEYSGELQRLADGHSAIEFCGVFNNSKIAEVMADLDVLVVPSLWYENTPLVIYSAQASRCPVVASDFPGISEVIQDGVNGLLFEAGNVAALAKRLSRLFDEPGLAVRLSANARQPKSTAAYVDELLGIWNVA